MPLFSYQALDANGQAASGELEADDAQLAIGELHARGLNVQFIGIVAPSSASSGASDSLTTAPPYGPVERSDPANLELDVLRSHMAVILDRGRMIVRALRAYAEEMPTGWQRRQLLSVCRIIEKGGPAEAADALAALPECWIPLLSAATNSPDPSRVLRDFLRETQRTDDLRQKWWLTLFYPLVLSALSLSVMTALSVFVIPEFRKIFDEFSLELPWLTRFILDLGSFLATWGLALLFVVGALIIVFLLKVNRLLPASFLSAWGDRLRLPFGRRTAIARFSRFLADLLEADVSIPDSLRIAGFTVDQTQIRQSAWKMATDLESAGSPRASYKALTSSVAMALAPELRPESRIHLLREISDCHAERIRLGTSWTAGLFEPLAICAVGAVVGLTVLALYLPLISLISGLSS